MIVTFVLTCCGCMGIMFFGWFKHLLPQLRIKLGKVRWEEEGIHNYVEFR
jgi:hypothetical protein